MSSYKKVYQDWKNDPEILNEIKLKLQEIDYGYSR